MKANQKQMFVLLRQQLRELQQRDSPEQPNTIPENFNQIGWELTLEKVEQLRDALANLREVKGKRLTPQFYRTIYNRCLIGMREIEKVHDSLMLDDETIDFEAENRKMLEEIQKLEKEVQ